jgi:hypothetical protein
MKVLLTCPECDFQMEGQTDKSLMNNIVMWNHSKKVHPQTAERIMRTYQILPSHFYDTRISALNAGLATS